MYDKKTADDRQFFYCRLTFSTIQPLYKIEHHFVAVLAGMALLVYVAVSAAALLAISAVFIRSAK